LLALVLNGSMGLLLWFKMNAYFSASCRVDAFDVTQWWGFFTGSSATRAVQASGEVMAAGFA
jgi:hypothetical protein